MGLRVLVCGGRNFSDRTALFAVLDRIRPTVVIEGGARGADRLAGEWADSRGIVHLSFPANWSSDGAAAGPIRNRRMLTDGKPDLVVAFPGGRGTADMIRQARASKVPVRHEGRSLPTPGDG